MKSTTGGDPGGRSSAPDAPVDHHLEGKLRPPPRRGRWVQRSRLVDAMARATLLPVTLVAAPAGYGKTTLVAQWLETREQETTGWLTLDPDDNDPDRLWAHVGAALERAGCAMPVPEASGFLGRGRGGSTRSALRTVLDALAATPDDVVLVLDEFQFIQSPTSHEQVEAFVHSLPPHAHLVIITRSDPGLRLGRLRVSSDLAELRAADLAFSPQEASQLLDGAEVQLSADALALLMERTEGWPAAIYLASLSLAGRADPDAYVRGFSGGNRFIGDYLTEEVLSRHSERVSEFILRASVLDRLSASLCDEVLGIGDSAAILRDLEKDNLFLVPLDADWKWFRFHHLFAAVARSELELKRPEEVAELHARAARWFADRGRVHDAVHHFLAAGRPADAAHLVEVNWLKFAGAGLQSAVVGWLEGLGEPWVRTDPAARTTAAWMAAIVGDETGLADHLTALEGLEHVGPLPDGSRSVESAVALIGGYFGYGGPLEMLAASRRAVELETDAHSPFHTIAQAALGHAWFVLGDLDRAITPIRAASLADRAPGVVGALAWSVQSLIEDERGNTSLSREAAEQAMEIVDTLELRTSPESSLAFAALGQAQARAGKVGDALATLELGLALRRQSAVQALWGPIHHLLVTARVVAEHGDPVLARDLLAELDTRMGRFSDGMTVMQSRAAAVHRVLTDRVAAARPHERLTDRELDVLQMLQGSLTLNEISTELFLSANTVKTHASAVYRKLGAHSRAEAVRIARSQSLI